MSDTRRRCLQAGSVVLLAPLLEACTTPPIQAPEPDLPELPELPALPRAFRAAWVASVAHIDWPSKAGLNSAEQRAEMHTLLDHAQALGLNALVLQVRPSADALYPSALEPWSEYLTGTSGQPPDEAWDPLAEWVDGAHRRGLELHAWFNPYRARHPSARGELAASHIAHTDPAIVKRYGEWLWMDPAEPRAAQRMVDVVLDVLRRYDIDGVHIDDYFYPYPVNDAQGKELPFPDEPAWQRYLATNATNSTLARDDWRRAQVDQLIERLYREIHAVKPWVRFGVSPFGLPRPDRRPPGIAGFSQYDKLYADVERWWQQGWMDYLAPQLYWPIAQAPQAFDVLHSVWREGNGQQRHLWPGLFTSRLGAERNAYDAAEVLAQVARTPGGHIHFSMAALLQNRDAVADQLRRTAYATPALTPATPWLAEPPPRAPAHAWRPANGRTELWPLQGDGDGPPLRQAVLWQLGAQGWHWQARPLPATTPFTLDPGARARWLVGIGRSGLESAPADIGNTFPPVMARP